MRRRFGPAIVFAMLAAASAMGWLVVSSLGWVESLTVLTGDGNGQDVARGAVVLAAWFLAVLGAPVLALAALVDLLLSTAQVALPGVRGSGSPKGRRRNQ